MIKDIMGQITTTEEEYRRILELHKKEFKRYHLKEQDDIGLIGKEDTDNRKKLFKDMVDKVNSMFGNTIQVLKDSKVLADNNDTYKSIGKLTTIPDELLMKLGLFNKPSTSGWKDYDSLLSGMKVIGSHKNVITYMLTDLIQLRQGLIELSSELSGFRKPDYNQFRNWKVGDVRTFLKDIHSKLGIG